MTAHDIQRMVNEVFEEDFEIERDRLLPEMHIFADLGLDSLDIVDLVVAMQKKFGVRIRDDGRVRDIRTLGDVYEFIEMLRGERVAGAGE